MLCKALALSALVALVLAQTSGSAPFPDLATLFNETEGFSYISTYFSAYPEVLNTLKGLKNVTVLAPKNSGLYSFLEDPRYAALQSAGEEYLQSLISYHILPGIYDNLTDWRQIPTLLTSPEYTNVTGGQVVFGYYDTFGFEASFYSGQELNAVAGSEPIEFDGGIVYPIDNLLNIPLSLEGEIVGDINGTSFIELLDSTGLLAEFQGLKDVTILVPNDTAIALVQDSLNGLSPEDLADVLRYHVVEGTIAYYAEYLSPSTNFTLTTLQGEDISIVTDDVGYSYINGAAATWSDIAIANGVAILIDQVLNPKDIRAAPIESEGAGVPSFPTNTIATETESSQSTGSSTSSAATETFNGAASSIKTGAESIAAAFAVLVYTFVL